MGWVRRIATLVLLAPLSVAAAAAEVEYDPWEGFNRSIFAFNETLDRYLILPATRGYRAITPDPVERGVSRFFDNLGDVTTLVNNLLQLKLEAAMLDGSRVLANTTFGVGGIFDVATPLGIERHDEDFGQTLGYWGVAPGPYLVLPFFGPSSVRDGIAKIPDTYTQPLYYVENDEVQLALTGLKVLDTRAGLMEKEKLISGDRYSFIRDAWWQRRAYQVSDGQLDDSFGDDF